MVLLAIIRREQIHAQLRMPGRVIISRPRCKVNGGLQNSVVRFGQALLSAAGDLLRNFCLR
jgi:hypothetical protein